MVGAVIAMAVSGFATVRACGLEPAINDGFTVSHPRSIDVAVAVANARRAGKLPAATADSVANDERLRALIGGLQRLQARLNAGSRSGNADSAGPFSVVLVGPGLWSHFHSTPDAVFARYHVDGPMADQAVVVTHAAVLKALLLGNLSFEQAVADDLVVFSGGDRDQVRIVFAASFPATA
jgi:hypothetical protein